MTLMICCERVVKSAFVLGFAVTIALRTSPAKVCKLRRRTERARGLTVLDGCTAHQVGGGCHVRLQLPLAGYTTSVLFRHSLYDLVVAIPDLTLTSALRHALGPLHSCTYILSR